MSGKASEGTHVYNSHRKASPVNLPPINRPVRPGIRLRSTSRKKRAIPPPLEKDVLACIVDYFAVFYQITLHRRNTGAVKASYKGKSRFVRFSEPGQSDLWGIQPKTGRHIEIEVKREGEEPTEKQREWLQSCRDSGAIAFWADSVNRAIVEFELAAFGHYIDPKEL